MIKAILFDLDGTLRDSRAAIHPAIEIALKKLGVQVDDRVTEHVHSLRSVHAAFIPNESYEDFRDSYDENLKNLMHTIVTYEHVREVLGQLKEQGYKIGLVSSSRYAHESLDQDGLTQFFDVVVGGLDTTKHKPHPESITLALKKLKIAPNQSVMVGDLAADILAGKSAGVFATVGITHGFGTRKVLEKAGADHIIDSLKALPKLIDDIE